MNEQRSRDTDQLIGCLIVLGALPAYYLLRYVIGPALAYLGMTLLIPIDYFARTFVWVGVSNPATGWLLLGCLVGGMVGLVQGLTRGGRERDVRRVYEGAITLACVFLLASAYAPRLGKAPRPPTRPAAARSAPAKQPTFIPAQFTASALVGVSWEGTYAGKEAKLSVDRAGPKLFYGTLTVGAEDQAVRRSIRGYVPGSENRVRFVVLSGSDKSAQTLAENEGKFSEKDPAIAGTGEDSKGKKYNWWFKRVK